MINKLLPVSFMLLLIFNSCSVDQDPKILEIENRGTLIVGADIPYGIMEYYDDSGNPAGVDVTLAENIAEELQVDLDFRNVPWDELFSELDNGEIDLAISAISITQERSERMLFSQPYFEASQVIVAGPKFEDDILLDTEGKIVGVQSGTTSEMEAKKLFSENSIKTYDSVDVKNSIDGIIYDLLQENIDFIIVDKVVALQLVPYHNSKLKILDNEFEKEYYGVAAKLGNEELINRVNVVVAEFAE